jgi:hypothetical protein
MTKKKLIRYFQDTKNLGKSALKIMGVKMDMDFERMLDGQISVDRYVNLKFFPK